MTEALALVATLLQILAAAPASSSFLTPSLDRILSTIANLIMRGEAGFVELKALTAHIEAMVKAGTDPTQGDWDTLKARSDAAHAAIQEGAPAASKAAGQPVANKGV